MGARESVLDPITCPKCGNEGHIHTTEWTNPMHHNCDLGEKFESVSGPFTAVVKNGKVRIKCDCGGWHRDI